MIVLAAYLRMRNALRTKLGGKALSGDSRRSATAVLGVPKNATVGKARDLIDSTIKRQPADFVL
jgi:hypothetical protein